MLPSPSRGHCRKSISISVGKILRWAEPGGDERGCELQRRRLDYTDASGEGEGEETAAGEMSMLLEGAAAGANCGGEDGAGARHCCGQVPRRVQIQLTKVSSVRIESVFSFDPS